MKEEQEKEEKNIRDCSIYQFCHFIIYVWKTGRKRKKEESKEEEDKYLLAKIFKITRNVFRIL